MNHLLKAPFVIHPKTGRVCVPFRVSKVDSFDPEKVGFFTSTALKWSHSSFSFQVPTVLQLVEEIDSFSKAEEESEVEQNKYVCVDIVMSNQVKRNVKAYKMTSMREPVSIFEEFLSGLASERKGQLIAQSDAKMEIWEIHSEKTSGFKIWILKCDIDRDLLHFLRVKRIVQKPTQRENRCFVKLTTRPLCKYISPQHSRVAKRDQLQESRCRRRSTIPTSTKTTSMSTGTSCFQRLGFSVQIFSINVSALSSPSPSWCPRRTACLNRSGETLGFSRALGKH